MAGIGGAVLDSEDRVVDLLPAVERKRKTFREKTVFLWSHRRFVLTLGIQFLDATIAGGRSDDAKSVLKEWDTKIGLWTRRKKALEKKMTS